MASRKVSRRRNVKVLSKKRVKDPVDVVGPVKEVIWSVTNVSVIRSPDQVKKDGPILHRLLEEAELNLRWERFFATEECSIQQEGICFRTRTLYRRLEIVVSYLHALKIRRQREKKSLTSVPNPVYVEVTLERKFWAQPKKSVSAVVVPFSRHFTSKDAALEAFENDDDLCHGRFILKLHVHSSKISRASIQDDYGRKNEKLEIGSDQWLQAETAIDKEDANFLFGLKKAVMSDIAVVMLKPIDKPET